MPTILQNSGERAGVRIAIALELVVEIAVRVNVQDRQRRTLGHHRPQDRMGDGVIAAECNRLKAVGQQGADADLDLLTRLRRRLR